MKMVLYSFLMSEIQNYDIQAVHGQEGNPEDFHIEMFQVKILLEIKLV